MRYSVRLLIIVFALISAYPALAKAAPSPADDVLAVDAAWARALVACDVERMRNIVSDDLTMVNLQGAIYDKAAFLKTVSSCPIAEGQPHNVKVRFYGESASVVGTFRYKQKGQGQSLQQVYTRLYVLQGGAWRLVSNSHTPLSEAAAAANVTTAR